MRPAGLSVVALLAIALFPIQSAAQEALMDLSGRAARVSQAGASGRLVEPGPSRDETVRRFLRGAHDEATLAGLSTTREHASRGMVHLTYQQRVGNLDVYGTFVRASFTQAGDLRRIGENLVPAARAIRPALVGPEAALRVVLARYYPEVTSLPGEVSDIANVVTFARVAPLAYQPTVKRVALPLRGAVLDAGYLVVTWDRSNVLRHTAVSGRGEIVGEQLRTYNDDYFVFPISPGVGPQTLLSSPADPIASPSGWLSGNTTTGNNVDAYLDRDADNLPDSPNGRPNGGGAGVFSFIWDPLADPTTINNQRVAVTNLFYHTNLFHDRMYAHGFTETAGNFQQSNHTRGGVEGDPLLAEAQDGGGTNNANFSFAAPDDGLSGKIQMYLWTASSPLRDGSLDADIIYHEYTHGLTWRMVGDMSGVTGAAVGEGMSDAIAAYLTNDDRIAEYSYNNPNGIRNYPYTNYPRTYGLVVGFTGPHLDGEIFAAAMWRLRELWLGQGWSQDLLLDYVVDGLNYVLPKPAFEHVRDGILSSIANTGGNQAESCTVWRAFAQYGVGVGASGTEVCIFGTLCFFTAVESFDVPASCPSTPINTVPLVLIQQPANGSSVPAGTSVTFVATASDNQDGDLTEELSWESSLQGSIGSGGSFSHADLDVGTHIITARVTDSGSLTGSDSITLTVEGEPPPPNTAPTVTITSPANGTTVIDDDSLTFSGTGEDTQDGDLSGSLRWSSNLDGFLGTGASLAISTLRVGQHAITASVTDTGGLSGSASIVVNVNPKPITLSVAARKVKGKRFADLTWANAAGDNVEIYRNNTRILASTPNDGSHTDSPPSKGTTFTYRVCEIGGARCSPNVTVTY